MSSPISSSSGKSVFITVGTTKFDKLIKAVTEADIEALLRRLGFVKVLLQIGNGTFVPPSSTDSAVQINYYRFKPGGIDGDISDADLVISHAGAGSILECLYAGKRLLVVVNEDLMNNHQTELARQLDAGGHLRYCYCSNLGAALEGVMTDWTPQPLTKGKPHIFAHFLTNYLASVNT